MRVFNSNANKEFINYNLVDLVQKRKIEAPESDQIFLLNLSPKSFGFFFKSISETFWIFFGRILL